MITVWVLLIFWTPPDGVPVIDLSVVDTGFHAYRTESECQQARADILDMLVADHRKALSRCDSVAIAQPRAVGAR